MAQGHGGSCTGMLFVLFFRAKSRVLLLLLLLLQSSKAKHSVTSSRLHLTNTKVTGIQTGDMSRGVLTGVGATGCRWRLRARRPPAPPFQQRLPLSVPQQWHQLDKKRRESSRMEKKLSGPPWTLFTNLSVGEDKDWEREKKNDAQNPNWNGMEARGLTLYAFCCYICWRSALRTNSSSFESLTLLLFWRRREKRSVCRSRLDGSSSELRKGKVLTGANEKQRQRFILRVCLEAVRRLGASSWPEEREVVGLWGPKRFLQSHFK